MVDRRLGQLLAEIEEALIVSGVSATRFGYFVSGDAGLVNKLRKGRSPRGPLRGKIVAALAKMEREGTL